MSPRRVPCAQCGQALNNGEIALCIKLTGLAAPHLLCLPCQALALMVPEGELKELIAFYSSTGCVHFTRDYLA